MMRAFHGLACFSVLAGLTLFVTGSRAGDDIARFYGTWKTSVPMSGQTVTIVSVHDASGYKNFIETPTGQLPAGNGTFKIVGTICTEK
jgi:hypothetical protein